MTLMPTCSKSAFMLMLISLLSIGLIASCSSAPAPTETARLFTPTPIPTFQFVQPTAAPQLATLAAATVIAEGSDSSVTEIDPEKVARGKDRYEVLDIGMWKLSRGKWRRQ
jgi:hypothetical protein